MRRAIAASIAVLVTALTIGAAGPVSADDRPAFSAAEDRALDRYEECWAKYRPDNPCGRNKVDDGVLRPDGTTRALTSEELGVWHDRLERIVNPPPVPTTTYTYDPGTGGYAGAPAPAPDAGGACPGYMSGEADSPSDVNPSSGAAGCYQIIPETQAAYGCAAPDAECASRICDGYNGIPGQGDGAWDAADPCAYLE